MRALDLTADEALDIAIVISGRAHDVAQTAIEGPDRGHSAETVAANSEYAKRLKGYADRFYRHAIPPKVTERRRVTTPHTWPEVDRRNPRALRAGDRIEFVRGGVTLLARVMPGVDSDPTANVWAVDLNDPDKSYTVSPREVTNASRGRA